MALTDQLVSYYKLDESSGNASDSVGSNTLTNVNSTAYATGKINNGADLESSSSNHFTLGSQPFNYTTGTFATWIKLESNPGTRAGIGGNGTNSGTSGFSVRLDASTNKVDFFLGAGNQITQSTTNLSLATWYHLVCTWDTSEKNIYINGSLEATNGVDETMTSGGTTFYLGTDPTSTTHYFDGVIDELGIWNRVLSSTEISQLYNTGTGLQYPFSTNYTLTCETGSYSLSGISVPVGVGVVAQVGQFILSGIDIIFEVIGWTNRTKNTSTWTNSTKNSSTWTSVSKSISSWTNRTKN